jgi:hypothetical protein
MEDTLITFKTAKLAKEKGFNIFTDVCFANTPNSDNKQYKKIKLHHSHSVGSVDSFGNILTIVAYAPTQSLLAKWLREQHNIHIEISNNNYNKLLNWSFDLHRLPVGIIQMWKRGDITYNTYEEAYEVGLQEALKLI